MRPRHKETHGTTGRRAAPPARALLWLAGGLAALGGAAACGDAGRPADPATAPTPAPPPGASDPLPTVQPDGALAAELSRVPALALEPWLHNPDPAERRAAARALGRTGAPEAADLAAQLLRDADPAVRAEACFAIGVTGSPKAAALLGPILESNPTPDEVAAAAAGLANCGDDDAGALLLRIALRDDLPVEAPEALFRHVRWRNRPWTGPLPYERLLRYEKHPTPRGRAGLGWMGRIWRDKRLLEPLERLAKDPSAEVRRAAALGLGEGRPDERRPAGDADRAVATLRALLADADVSTVVSACRAIASYERPDAVAALRGALGHASFQVRTAVVEGLAQRKAADAADDIARLARKDPSPSVRGAAAAALRALDPAKSRAAVEGLLGDPSDFVRAAGAESLAASDDPDAEAKLVRLARTDPHTRVRQTALDGLKGRTGPEAVAAVKEALAGSDPVLVSVAADVAATNDWKTLAPDLLAAWDRHPGTAGADAREGLVAALAKLAPDAAFDRLASTAIDGVDPGPRDAAEKALAELRSLPAPPVTRTPRTEGAAGPQGAPILAGDVDLVVVTDQGTMRIRLDAANAPLHAAHLAALARKGFYDGLAWHRMVPDFVIQGGCPRGDGAGNAGVNVALEPTRTPFERGTLGMPRSSHPDTGGCQLFICHSRAPHLDVQYSAIGRVVEGLDVIDRIDVGSRILRVSAVPAK